MTSPLTINQAFERLAELDGRPLELEGILVAHDYGGYELLHYPSSEWLTCYVVGKAEYPPAIWLAFGNGSLKPNQEAFTRWSGKRVRVHGVLRSVHALREIAGLGKGGFGPSGFWPAVFETYILQRLTAEERRQSSIG